MADIKVKIKGAIDSLKNTMQIVTGTIFNEGEADERFAMDVNILGGNFGFNFPTGDDAVMKDKTLSDIIVDDKLNIHSDVDTSALAKESGGNLDTISTNTGALSTIDQTLTDTKTILTDGSQKAQLIEPVITGHYDEDDVTNDVISLQTPSVGIIVKNLSTTNSLTITPENGVSIILDPKTVDDNDVVSDYKFYGRFAQFETIAVVGTSPDFELYTESVVMPDNGGGENV